MEAKPKKNPDYSKKAKSLNNSPEIAAQLERMKIIQENIKTLVDELHETEIQKKIDALIEDNKSLTDEIKANVNKLGGYQDIERGMYALIQLRDPYPEYPVDLVKQQLPADLLPLVVEQIVNVTKLEALCPAYITSEKLRLCSLPKEPTEALIIKVV